MKRKIMLLLLVMSISLVSGCNPKTEFFPDAVEPTLPDAVKPELDDGLTDVELVYAIADYLKEEIPNVIKSDFSVLTIYNDIVLEWTSSDEEIVSINNGIVSVKRSFVDKVITLSVDISSSEYKTTQTFDVVVEKVLPANEVIALSSENLSNERNYYKETTGTSYADALVNVNQKITNTVYVYEEYTYANLESSSWAVKFTHQAVFKNDNVSYYHTDKIQTSNNPSETITKDTYLDKYGIDYTTKNFTGFVINDDTVLSSSYLGVENSLHMYEYELDLNESCVDMKLQMKELGGLKSFPIFSSIKIVLYVDNDYNVCRYDSIEAYDTVKFVFGFDQNASLIQNLVTVIHRFDEETKPDTGVNLDAYLASTN